MVQAMDHEAVQGAVEGAIDGTSDGSRSSQRSSRRSDRWYKRWITKQSKEIWIRKLSKVMRLIDRACV